MVVNTSVPNEAACFSWRSSHRAFDIVIGASPLILDEAMCALYVKLMIASAQCDRHFMATDGDIAIVACGSLGY